MWTRNNVTFVWFVWFTWRKESHNIYKDSVSQALLCPSHPGGVEMTCRERRAASEIIPLDKLLPWVGSILILIFAPCYMHCSEGSGLCSQVSEQHLLLCVHLANWRPQTTRQTATRVFKILPPQWQWIHQVSNSSAKWKITVLWFYFVDWSRFPSGHTQNCTELQEKGHPTAQPGMGSDWGKALRATQNMFGMTECTKVVQPCIAACF